MHKAREYRFRAKIEGCIPDLMEAGEGTMESCPSDFRDSLHDYVADRSSDEFPNMEREERMAMIERIVDHFCGKEEPTEGPILLSKMFPMGGD